MNTISAPTEFSEGDSRASAANVPAMETGLPRPEIILSASADRRQVFLTISQTPREPYLATAEDVYKALAAAGFEFGILHDKIEKIIAGKLYITQTLIAEMPKPHLEVAVSDDKLQALLTITQVPAEPYMATVEDIYGALAQAGVEYGVLTDKIEQIVAGRIYPERMVVAQGQAPNPGRDGQIEYCFTSGNAGQAHDLGYRVDYRNLNLVENVHAGQALAIMIPAIESAPGITVYGRPINVAKVKKVRLPVGKGTKVSPENPFELVAEIDGFVRLDKTSFEQIVVEQEFQVLESVDLSTGNLNIEGSVRIFKDVRDGFQVKATGNILVHGSVEGCYLEAGGNIEIKGGIIGGKQRARAQAIGDVMVKFADNADISAGGLIAVTEEALNCTLQTERIVTVGDEKIKSVGAIIGGQVIAGQLIKAVSVGTPAGTITRLRVGERPNLLNRRRAMERELTQQEAEFEQLELRVKSLLERHAARNLLREDRFSLRGALEQQQGELADLMKGIISQGEEAGLIVPGETIRILQNEIGETRQNLDRVEASALALLNKINNDPEPAKTDQDMLVQLKLARQNLAGKLKLQEIQLGQLTKDPWKKLPWAWRRELEMAQAKLQTITGQLATIAAEDTLDQKIELAIAQSISGRDLTLGRLEALRAELDQVRLEIESLSKTSPHVIITGRLWAGTEVVVLRQKEHFTISTNAVRIQLSSISEEDDRRMITILPL